MSQSVVRSTTEESRKQSSAPSVNGRSVQTSPSDTTQKPRGFVRRTAGLVLSSIGPTLVLIGFAVVFYYGHHNDWRIPKFAALTGEVEPVVDDWCEEHAVPESICVECDPTLMPKGPDYGWCSDHGVHNCVLDHPDVAQLKQPPSRGELAADLQRAARALAIAPRKENNSGCKIYQTRIQFASIEAVMQAGVDVVIAALLPIVVTRRTAGTTLLIRARQIQLGEDRVFVLRHRRTKDVGGLPNDATAQASQQANRRPEQAGQRTMHTMCSSNQLLAKGYGMIKQAPNGYQLPCLPQFFCSADRPPKMP